jgi:hypothetical protein
MTEIDRTARNGVWRLPASVSVTSLWLMREAVYANRKDSGKAAKPIRKTCQVFETRQVGIRSP